MDFADKLKQFSKNVEKMKDRINSEEATKTSLVMPFFQILGYDVFNPDEFVPEFTADVGIKKGEKVDYAIMKDGKPLILIEAKPCTELALDSHGSQLFRYFTTTEAKFAILTNGLTYMFYTDLVNSNKMDNKPFFIFNILNVKEHRLKDLEQFKKEKFDVDTIMDSASELKYSNEFKHLMTKLIANPSDSFVYFVMKEIYSKKRTQKAKNFFNTLIKRSFDQYINELISDRLTNVLENQSLESEDEVPIISDETSNSKTIVTTAKELEAFYTIKTFFHDIVSLKKITYKDTLSYFGILLDNNTRKWICRIYFKENISYFTVPDENKKEVKYELDSLQDLFNYKDVLIKSLQGYL
ncbi:MAG: type I restriction endonuclease [Alkaliphilus sp.]